VVKNRKERTGNYL